MPDFRSALIDGKNLSRDDLATILYELHDYIGIHEVEFDEFDCARDARLVWWNRAYGQIRTKSLEFRQSMVESYYEPSSALFHVNEAWHLGESTQFFELSPAMRDRYRILGARVVNWVKWFRVGEHIVEVGTDLKELADLRALLNDQQTIIASATRERAMAVERERIAHGLHDSVIQNLYAISLVLARAGREAEEPASQAIKTAVAGLEGVVRLIRREIFELENSPSLPLRDELTKVLESILAVTHCRLAISVCPEPVSNEFYPHILAVAGEAASNAVRHGGATHLWIDVCRKGGMLRLTVTDDGSGINPRAPLQNGLRNMRERAESLGGTMEITQRDGGGTRITWTVPHFGGAS